MTNQNNSSLFQCCKVEFISKQFKKPEAQHRLWTERLFSEKRQNVNSSTSLGTAENSTRPIILHSGPVNFFCGCFQTPNYNTSLNSGPFSSLLWLSSRWPECLRSRTLRAQLCGTFSASSSWFRTVLDSPLSMTCCLWQTPPPNKSSSASPQRQQCLPVQLTQP